MKLLVFAHTPPPHHGQSYMVQLMLEGFGGDARSTKHVPNAAGIECYHVNARLSDTIEDIGAFRIGKVFHLIRYCITAIYLRFRFGIHAFYYVPAPGKRAALVRDWVVMMLCRPFFRNFIHHWHAVGMGDWLKNEGTWLERRITHLLLGKPTLGLALAITSMRDALWFRSHRVELVPNGIPDPCPEFDRIVHPIRQNRLARRNQLIARSRDAHLQDAEELEVFRVLFLANLLRDKGIFDALDGVALANRNLADSRSPLRIHLTVAGAFPNELAIREFDQRVNQPDLQNTVEFKGFVTGQEKLSMLREHDCLLFPSFYHAESFGLVVVEAMAVGMAVVTTRWRALPDLLPPGYPGVVSPRSPGEISRALIAAMHEDASPLRGRFLCKFTQKAHLDRLKSALLSVNRPT